MEVSRLVLSNRGILLGSKSKVSLVLRTGYILKADGGYIMQIGVRLRGVLSSGPERGGNLVEMSDSTI